MKARDMSLAKFYTSTVSKYKPHRPTTNQRPYATATHAPSYTKYKPPINLFESVRNIRRSEKRGRHEMWIGNYEPWDTPCFIKDITEFTLGTEERRWQGQSPSVPFEDCLQDAQNLSLYLTEREVFITRLIGHMAPDQTSKHIAVATSHYSLDDGSPLPKGRQNYYVMSSLIPDFEALSTFPDLKERFSVNERGYTVFDHPTEGHQEVTGRIALKIILRLLGESDANLENLALGPKNANGQRHFVTIDHELCNLRLPELQNTLVTELTTGTVGTIFADMDLSGLAIRRRKEVKDEIVLRLDRLCNTPEGQTIVKNIIVETFSPHGKKLEHDVYQPLREISEVLAESAARIRTRQGRELGWQARIVAENAVKEGIKL